MRVNMAIWRYGVCVCGLEVCINFLLLCRNRNVSAKKLSRRHIRHDPCQDGNNTQIALLFCHGLPIYIRSIQHCAVCDDISLLSSVVLWWKIFRPNTLHMKIVMNYTFCHRKSVLPRAVSLILYIRTTTSDSNIQ